MKKLALTATLSSELLPNFWSLLCCLESSILNCFNCLQNFGGAPRKQHSRPSQSGSLQGAVGGMGGYGAYGYGSQPLYGNGGQHNSVSAPYGGGYTTPYAPGSVSQSYGSLNSAQLQLRTVRAGDVLLFFCSVVHFHVW